MLKNLFAIKYLGGGLLSPWTWRLAQLAALAALLAMAAWGWHQHAIPGVPVKDPLMYTNLATFLFWVLWIMGVVFVALFLGRAWCTVCPLGWLNGLAARVGLQRPLPGWLRNFVPVTLTLVALQLAVYLLAVHRFPDYTARLLALMLLLAVGCGLLFRKRAFCSLFCPAGAVFGLYARLAPFRLRVADPAICAACDSRSCVSGAPAWKRFTLGPAVLLWRGERPDCPADLSPEGLGDDAACSLCLHCARNCDKGNVLLGRRPWLGGLGEGGLGAGETFFFVVLLGMLTANFCKVFTDLREAIFWAPQQAALLLGWGAAGFYFLAALWVTLAFPVLLLLPGYALLRLAELRVEAVPAGADPQRLPDPPPAEDGRRFWPALGRLALPLLPLALAAHVVLAVVKLNAKGPYLPYVLRDPSGVKSYLAMNVMHTVQAPGVLIPLDILKWLVLALVVGGYLLALAAARRTGCGARGFMAAAAVSATLVAALYGATVIRWLFIR
jgi:hypothetical protein